MKRLDLNTERFVQYGVASDLADRVALAGLAVTTARALSPKNTSTLFALSRKEAKEVKGAVHREPIDKETLYALLAESRYRLCLSAL
jgi:hypothetical protein